ncbi:MAG: hypothetical protein AAF560_17820 [Acidobacteriota bacterium]
MSFYTEVANGSSASDLESNLNSALAKYSGVSSVSGCGIEYGDGNQHAGVEFQASGTGASQPEIQVWAASNSNLSNIGTSLDSAVKNMGTVENLALYYDKNNDKWRALVVYLTQDSGKNYQAMGQTNSKGSNLESNIENAVGDASGVPAFGYAYGNDNNGALVVWF